jgi:hypothetical protein
MYRFKNCNPIKLVCFIKFVVHKINSEMVKYRMVVLTEREKANVAKTDMVVGWMMLVGILDSRLPESSWLSTGEPSGAIAEGS